MNSLRHLGREVYRVRDKLNGRWLLENNADVFDLSGGPLLHTLAELKLSVPEEYNHCIGASGGIETSIRCELETELLERAGTPGGGMLWASSGSDAIEFGIWAIHQKNFADGLRFADTYVVRAGGYHGNTYLTAWLSTRRGLSNSTLDSALKRHILSEDYGCTDGEVMASRAIEQLSGYRLAKGSIVVLETAPTTGAVFWPGYAYYEKVLKWCRANGVEVILDEIASGGYRNGWFSAFEWLPADCWPSVLALSKSLTAGLYPLSCVLLCPGIAEIIRSANRRYPAFTYGLNDTSAFITMHCLKTYDNLKKTGKLSQRERLIEQYTGAYQELRDDFLIEKTKTTIRLSTQSEPAARHLSQMLKANNMTIYEASTVLNEGTIYFFLVCPSLDIENEKVDELLRKVKFILTKV
jgi:adenosylmethionine-8-amino-7-oxononanoate aminotransferase